MGKWITADAVSPAVGTVSLQLDLIMVTSLLEAYG